MSLETIRWHGTHLELLEPLDARGGITHRALSRLHEFIPMIAPNRVYSRAALRIAGAYVLTLEAAHAAESTEPIPHRLREAARELERHSPPHAALSSMFGLMLPIARCASATSIGLTRMRMELAATALHARDSAWRMASASEACRYIAEGATLVIGRENHPLRGGGPAGLFAALLESFHRGQRPARVFIYLPPPSSWEDVFVLRELRTRGVIPIELSNERELRDASDKAARILMSASARGGGRYRMAAGSSALVELATSCHIPLTILPSRPGLFDAGSAETPSEGGERPTVDEPPRSGDEWVRLPPGTCFVHTGEEGAG